MINKWYEVWSDETHDIPYLLFLTQCNEEVEGCQVIDPKSNNQVVKKFPDYNSAKLWLLEDEFTLIDGRMELE
jgi:hypothetical protein